LAGSHYHRNELGYLIHTGRYKYELDDKNGDKPREVFTDLKVDPGETYNMIHSSNYAKKIGELKKELLAYMSNINKLAIVRGRNKMNSNSIEKLTK
jgi:hypothetical protein